MKIRNTHLAVFKGTKALICVWMWNLLEFNKKQKPWRTKGHREDCVTDISIPLVLLWRNLCKLIPGPLAGPHSPWLLFQHLWCLQSAPAEGHMLFGGLGILLLIVEIVTQILQQLDSGGLKRKKSKSNYVMSVSCVLCQQWHLPTFVKKRFIWFYF